LDNVTLIIQLGTHKRGLKKRGEMEKQLHQAAAKKRQEHHEHHEGHVEEKK
jgi:hypothetical protein